MRDVAAGAWHRDDFVETFGEWLPGRFRENWPPGTRIAVVLTFDTQGDIDAAIPGRSNGTWQGHDDKINYVDLNAVFRPQYHYNYDRHEGIAIGGGGSDYPDIDGNLQVNFKSGQDRTGHVDFDGKPDAYLDDIIRKQRGETDFQRRMVLLQDFQRHFASKMYTLFNPGEALGFKLAQPWLANWNAFSSMGEGSDMNEAGINMWIDGSKKS